MKDFFLFVKFVFFFNSFVLMFMNNVESLLMKVEFIVVGYLGLILVVLNSLVRVEVGKDKVGLVLSVILYIGF